MYSICGLDCDKCEWGGSCEGCTKTGGDPFGSGCVIIECCGKQEESVEDWKRKLIDEINALGIPGMEEVVELNALKGSYVNLEYTLPSGQKVRFWNDDRIYLGNQLHKQESDRCYGIVADETYLLVSEYGDYGADAEIVVLKRWK